MADEVLDEFMRDYPFPLSWVGMAPKELPMERCHICREFYHNPPLVYDKDKNLVGVCRVCFVQIKNRFRYDGYTLREEEGGNSA